jgi:hypothetical protein
MKADRRYLCDLDTAFDCVSHEILSGKMFCYDTCGVIVQWLESCLINRKQVKITLPNQQQKSSSNWGTTKCGILHWINFGTFVIHTIREVLISP